MKRIIILKALSLAFLCIAALQVQAQGIYVNKKGGESIAYPKAVFDRVSPYKQSSSEYGVRVYKLTGEYDYYAESELESITTYEEHFDERITHEIPVEYLSKISAYMPINSGNTPPNIEGVFNIYPNVMVYNSNTESSYKPGRHFNATCTKYSNQNSTQNTVTYQEANINNKGDVTSKSDETEAKILGKGSDFTAFTIVETTESDGTWTKMATLLSGTMTSSGVKNYFYAILMLDKIDPNKKKMDVGDFRVFKDEDGISEPTTWKALNRAARQTDSNTDVRALPNCTDAAPPTISNE